MSAGKHTPGPWRIERSAHVIDGRRQKPCAVVRGYGSQAEYLRNEFGAIQRFTAAEARAAIAKATGSDRG